MEGVFMKVSTCWTNYVKTGPIVYINTVNNQPCRPGVFLIASYTIVVLVKSFNVITTWKLSN